MSVLQEKRALNRSHATCLVNVKNLNCWGSDLNDIALVRKMINLEVLNFSVNNITGLRDLSYCPRLKEIYLRKNQITSIEEIRYLKNLKALKVLWLSDNPCCNVPNYRETVLRMLPNLSKLDSMEVSPDEVSHANQEGNLITEDVTLPNFDGLHLNKTLTLEAVLEYTAKPVVEEQKPVESNTDEKVEIFPSKSIDIDVVNKRREELGLKKLDISPINSVDISGASSFGVNTSMAAKQLQTTSAQSNVLNAVLLLLNDLDCGSLNEVISKATELLDLPSKATELLDLPTVDKHMECSTMLTE